MKRLASNKQRPGCLPPGFDLDGLLTPEQCAVWQQTSVITLRRRLENMPGVIQESRKCVLIHPRTYLAGRLKMKL